MTEAISMQSSIPATPPPQNHLNLQQGDFVWFDAGFGFPLPGEIVEVHRAAQIVIVSAIIDGKVSVSLQCEIEIASDMEKACCEFNFQVFSMNSLKTGLKCSSALHQFTF